MISEKQNKTEEELIRGFYDRFIRSALSSGFTDDQADFMWDFMGHYVVEQMLKELKG